MGSSIITTTGKKVMLNRTFKSTPDYTTFSVFKLGTGTTTPTENDTDLETPVNINGSQTKSFVTGYPIFDEDNLQVGFRCFVNSVESNGNSLTEFGLFNSDSTKKMWGRATHTPLTKSSSIEVTYIQKDKLI